MFLSCRENFGEGLHWAGLTIIALLKQEKRFNALDFASHILKVQEVDERQEVVAGIVSCFNVFLFYWYHLENEWIINCCMLCLLLT